LDYLNNKKNDLIVAVGPAGSGKTMFACLKAMESLRKNDVNKIILTRPVVPVEEDIGFLPGNIVKKMDPWTRPIFDLFLEYYSQNEITQMINNGIIEISPLAYMRGRTFKNAFIIADEMQNSSPNQMMMLTTRIGTNSRMVITGDLDQSDKFENNGLIGYRIEYITPNTSSNDLKIRNLFRVVTSNNRAEPVNQNLTNTNQKSIRYRFNDNSTLVFCTVSPSSESNVTPNVFPFIGQPNQEIIITNTYFNPLVLEVEIVDHDIETLAIGLFGNQTKSLDDGIYTLYNFSNDIYKQYNLYEIKDRFTGKPLYEVKQERSSIDFTKGYDNINNL
jgi:phosphate starvation-inducible PhoH-like protein